MAQVWYAAYGSNLLRRRFLHYLEGGAFAEDQPAHVGARNARPPRADHTTAVAGSVVFAGQFRRWGSGGAAFYDPTRPATAIVRLWSITAEQFADVAAQECGLPPGAVDIDLAELAERRELVVSSRSYGRVLWLGRRQGHPMVTVTAPEVGALCAPSPRYLEVMRLGLVEAGVSPEETDRYLTTRPGAADG